MRPSPSPSPKPSAAPRILALFGARVLFGQERANIEALAALRSEGCEVLCVIRPETWTEIMALRATLDARGLPWRTAPFIDYPARGWIVRTTLRNPAAYLRGRAAFRRIVRMFAPTHIHAFNPMHVAAFRGSLAALDVPLIYRAGDAPVLHNAFYRWTWRFIVRRAAHFVADSRFIEGALIASGVDAGRITVLYAPPPARTLADGEDPALEATDAFRFVYVGQVTAEKGVDLLVEAFRRLASDHSGIALLIAGPISDWSGHAWARELRERCRLDPALGPRVRFLGHVEDIPALLRGCRVHVAPSVKQEPYGLVVVEAKDAGLPSVIFDSGGMTELVIDGVDGTVARAKTADALARAMADYLTTPGLAARQGEAARTSLGRFGFERFGSAWLDVYAAAASL